jgi:predicted MFS family arabinose efflux permease
MGTYGTNMPVAIITAFPTATLLAQNFGWRASFYLGAVLSIACALLFLFTVKQGPLRSETKPVNMEITRAMKVPEVWKIGLVWMLFNTVTIGYLTWAPKLFEQFKGLDTFYASLLASLVMYSAVCFVPVFGWASDRSGRLKPFIVTGSLLMSLTLISIAYTYNIPLLISVLRQQWSHPWLWRSLHEVYHRNSLEQVSASLHFAKTLGLLCLLP